MAIAKPNENISNEVLDFLLSAPTPEEIIAFRPSEEVQARLQYLLDSNRNEALNDSECGELDSYLRLEQFIRQLKIRAQEKLVGDS